MCGALQGPWHGQARCLTAAQLLCRLVRGLVRAAEARQRMSLRMAAAAVPMRSWAEARGVGVLVRRLSSPRSGNHPGLWREAGEAGAPGRTPGEGMRAQGCSGSPAIPA